MSLTARRKRVSIYRLVQSQPLKNLIPANSYANQIMKQPYSVVSCVLNMEDLTSNNFRKFNK